MNRHHSQRMRAVLSLRSGFRAWFTLGWLLCSCFMPAHMVCAEPVKADWDSLAEHYKAPDWFQDGKIGVWIHWGIPSAIDENRPHDGSHYGAWMYGTDEQLSAAGHPKAVQALTDWHDQRYGPHAEVGYEDLIPLFTAENWDPDALVQFCKENGARFIMPVAVHHDNFDLYDSSHPWNALRMGPKRDLIGDWKAAAIRQGLKFGVSTHLYWSPRFFSSARKYQQPGTPEWDLFCMNVDPRRYASDDEWNAHWYARCWELIERYDPDMFNNDSPYPNERAGKGLGLKLFSSFLNRDLHENGGKQTTVLSFKDAQANKAAFTYNLERGMFGETQEHPWIWATDLSGSWFYRKGASTRMSIPVLIGNTVDAISKNGVVMLNLALRGDGTLPEAQAAYLQALGDWLRIHGEGIYGSRPWTYAAEGPTEIRTARSGENLKKFTEEDIRFTRKKNTVYAFVLSPPTRDLLIRALAGYKGIEKVEMLGSPEKLEWILTRDGLNIKRPTVMPEQPVIGFRLTLRMDTDR